MELKSCCKEGQRKSQDAQQQQHLPAHASLSLWRAVLPGPHPPQVVGVALLLLLYNNLNLSFISMTFERKKKEKEWTPLADVQSPTWKRQPHSVPTGAGGTEPTDVTGIQLKLIHSLPFQALVMGSLIWLKRHR